MKLEFFKDLAEKLDNVCYFIRPDYTLVWKNAKAKEFLKHSGAKKCFHVFYDRDVPCDDCNISIAKKLGSSPFITREINGYFFHHKLIPIYEDGIYIGSFILLSDITAQIQSEKREFIIQNRLNTIAEIANLGIWEVNPKERVVNYLSPLWYTMLGYLPYEMSPSEETFRDLLHEDDVDNVFEQLEDAYKKRLERFNMRYRLRKKNGDYQLIKACAKVIDKDQDGNPIKIIGVHFIDSEALND